MGWIQRLVSFNRTNQVTPVVDSSVYPNFKAAGVFFTDRKHVLAGYQPTKRTPIITGIGGTRVGTEPFLDTALRECIEEVFDIDNVPPALLQTIQRRIQPTSHFINKSYVTIVYTFTDLEHMLKVCKHYKLTSSLYLNHPTTLMDLIINRCHTPTSEIQSFALIPVCHYTTLTNLLDKGFIQDINMVHTQQLKINSPMKL
jgi:hypothetical protein